MKRIRKFIISFVSLAVAPAVVAQQLPCDGNACSDIKFQKTAASPQQIGSSTQVANHGTQSIQVVISTAASVNVGQAPDCSNSTSIQLAPSGRYQLAGFVCYPYHANYVSQSK